MLISQSLSGFPMLSIFRLMLCSMGVRTTQAAGPENLQVVPCC